MSSVLEEKIPLIRSSLIQQYGENSQSAVDAVSEGIQKVVSMGIGSVQDIMQNAENPTESVSRKFNAISCPIIGQKISEPGAFELALGNKEFEIQNPQLNSFAKSVFDKNGVYDLLSEKGIIIHGKPNQAEMPNSLDEKGFVIYGKPNQAEMPSPVDEKGVVGPEYLVFKNMEQTLKNTLSLQNDLMKSKLLFRA